MTGRILCLGDSLTYGFGLPRGLVWTALCAAQTGAELLGWGVNGNTTGGMLAVLPDLLVREHPDAVLLMGGTNDIAYGGDLAGARANMGAMAHLIIAGGGLPLIGIPPGLRRPIRREWAELMPERAAELLDKNITERVTAEDIAFLAASDQAGRKGCPAEAVYTVVLNKADDRKRRECALEILSLIHI